MSTVNLSWSCDGNIDFYDVYRSETTMDVNNLPAPIATGISAKSYADTSVVAGKVYKYRVSSIVGSLRKISAEISVSASNLAALAFIGSKNAGASSTITSLNIDIVPHNAGDIIILLVRAAGTPVASGFSTIYAALGFSVLAKIATTTNASVSTIPVTMNYGGLASIVLRPSHAVSSVSCEAQTSTYTAAAVANDTVNRALTTPASANDKTEIFEIDALQWSSIYSSVSPVSTISTDQQLIATRTYPVTVGDAFNFVVAGKARSNISSLNGATFNVTKIPPSAQTINAITARIYAS